MAAWLGRKCISKIARWYAEVPKGTQWYASYPTVSGTFIQNSKFLWYMSGTRWYLTVPGRHLAVLLMIDCLQVSSFMLNIQQCFRHFALSQWYIFRIFRHFSTLFIHIFLDFLLCFMPIPLYFSCILWPIILFNSCNHILSF